jgi:hypothetical protein
MKARVVVVGIILSISHVTTQAMWLSVNARNDPLPPYTTLDPQEYLYTRTKNRMKNLPIWVDHDERFSFSISPFGQNANKGRNIDNVTVPLGDLNGRWGMIALLYGQLPQGKVLPPTLAAARAAIFPAIPPGTPLTDGNFIDRHQRFGYFSIPLSYRKRGLRFQVATQLLCDVGLILEGGASDICQTCTGFRNLTCTPCIPPSGGSVDCCTAVTDNDIDEDGAGPFSEANVNDFLMNQLEVIAKQIGLKIGNFHRFSAEDFRMRLYWRHAYELNVGLVGKNYCWSKVLMVPFLMAGGSIAASKQRDPSKAFGLTFGNDGHHSVGVTGGLNFDFAETIEIGGEAGITHFFPRDFCNYRVPNSKFQTGIFPFSTDVRISPGFNWHFALKMSAYHFLDCLSFYFQYVLVHHERDKICLKQHDDAFKPWVLEKVTDWKVQVANMSFNYDISPNVSLGFLWQAPLARRRAYRSTTVMFSFNYIY